MGALVSLFKRRDVEVMADPGAYFSIAGGSPPQTPRPIRETTTFTIVPEEALPRVAPPAAPRPPRIRPNEPRASEQLAAAIQSEWARRAPRGAPEGRAWGMCSGCGTHLSVSLAPRPLRIACPECGRTRTLN